MKNKLNILLLISFLLASILVSWVYYQKTHRIGDIEFEQDLDNSKFMVCYKDIILQYYSIGTNYKGGKKAINKELSKLLKSLKFNETGLITFRFIVNCKNQIGIFRVKTINSNLKENNFKSENIKLIQESIKRLNGWQAGKVGDEKLDSYYVLNFKIQDGSITDIF